MTRFARAEGSKSSNKKTPEEATSWMELKKAVLNKSSCLSSKEKCVEIQGPKEPSYKCEPAEWASLDNDTVESNFSLIRQHHKNSKVNNKVAKKDSSQSSEIRSLNDTIDNGKASVCTIKKAKKAVDLENNVLKVENSVINNKKAKKIKRKSCNEFSEEQPAKKRNILKANAVKPRNNLLKKDEKKKLSKLNKKVNRKNNSNNLSEKNCSDSRINENANQIKTTEAVDLKDCPKNSEGINLSKKIKGNKIDFKSNNTNLEKKYSQNGNKFGNKMQFNKKHFKHKSDSNIVKKKFKKNYEKQDAVDELIVNGQKIQIVKFQGFNVTFEDAERLKKLRADMIREKIPKQKLEAALKLERRRAEKALSRLKKAVCFHCRGFGHVLSLCPLLTESQNSGTGICYKCGSTEHSATECKVVRGSNFQFAECFICKEQGHIAKQCPDNPRGLYPNGGACKVCGDVTHLKKDCPKSIAQKEEEMLTVGIRNDRNIESLDEEMAEKNMKIVNSSFKKNSMVKF